METIEQIQEKANKDTMWAALDLYFKGMKDKARQLLRRDLNWNDKEIELFLKGNK